MKTCNICKTVVRDDANFCTFCGSKIQTLEELINEKRSELNIKEGDLDCDINNKTNSSQKQDEEKQERDKINFLILVGSLIFLLLITLISFIPNAKDNKDTHKDYEVIQEQIDKNDYQGAYENIDKFLQEHENSKYNEELIKIKEDISDKINDLPKDFNNESDNNYVSLMDEEDKKSIDENILNQLYDATTKLNMDKDRVKLTSLTTNSKGEDIFSFSYNGHKFNATYDNNDSLVYIKNSENDKVYENGQVIIDVGSFIVSHEEMINLSKVSKMIVNLVHKEPTISKFPDINENQYAWNIICKDNVITITSNVFYVNDNSVSVRENFKIVLRREGEGYKLLDLIINGVKSREILY